MTVSDGVGGQRERLLAALADRRRREARRRARSAAGVTGEPKPITLPSRVPTYSLPAPTPGVANFEPVPIGALQRSTGLPLTGTGSYARSCAPAPVPFGIHSIHTSAEPEVVPSEVMTGAPVPKPQRVRGGRLQRERRLAVAVDAVLVDAQEARRAAGRVAGRGCRDVDPAAVRRARRRAATRRRRRGRAAGRPCRRRRGPA